MGGLPPVGSEATKTSKWVGYQIVYFVEDEFDLIRIESIFVGCVLDLEC